MPNIKLFIPNIEFRLSTFSGTADSIKRHNFHVLFDPSVSTQDIQEQFLNGIQKGYKLKDGIEWVQNPTRRSLEELGREMKRLAPAGNSIHSKTDLEVGANNITYELNDLKRLLERSVFKGKHLTAIGYSEWDQSRWDQSAAQKIDLINNSSFALVASQDVVNIESHITDLRANSIQTPILHSSDAHELAALNNSRLWIKADPTFTGLKQVINEPEARISISESAPINKPDHQYIERVEITNSNGWFAGDVSLGLNQDLTAVIGGRGSGKSALLEIMAHGAGCLDDSGDSFIEKAMRHVSSIEGTKVRLIWGDESVTESEIGGQMPSEPLVRYLPQKFVEKLCSPDHDSDLLGQIENVIFQALDITEKRDAADFASLREDLLQNFALRKTEIVSEIRKKNGRVYQLRKLIESLPAKKKDLEQKKKDLQKTTESLPKLPPEQQKAQDEIAGLLEWQRRFEDKIVELKNTIGRIPEIQTRIDIFSSSLQKNEEEIAALLAAVGISAGDMPRAQFDATKIKSLLVQRSVKLKQQEEILQRGAKTDVQNLIDLTGSPADNLIAIKAKIEEKMKETKAYETLKQKYQQYKKEMLRLEKEIETLSKEISRIETEIQSEFKEVSASRFDLYASYFDVLREEKHELEILYQPLQDSLKQGETEADKRLEFEARFHFALEDHLNRGIEILDRTKKGQFREVEDLREALMQMWKAFVSADFNKQVILVEIKKLSDRFQSLEDGTPARIEGQLKQVFTLEDFANWLLDLNQFHVCSSLKFDGTDLQLLSPGQKGIVLLLLYLQIDRDDNRPLLIDQPEDNLDNLSVYDDLIVYFRERKLFRQIIIATHNPNLVVNTDAEQVIIARYDGASNPRISYVSGSLEHCSSQPDTDGIIEKVCRILEGGKPAFVGRKKKYLLSGGDL